MPLIRILARSVDILPWRIRNTIRKIPVVAAFQRWLVNRVMKDQEFVHKISAGPAAGLMFRVKLPDDKLYWTGTWEPDVTTTIAAYIQPGMVCYDIGSHRGFMGGIMARNGAGKTYCFEPNPSNIAKIQDLIALNPDQGLQILPYAVGAVDGTARFELMPEDTMGKLSTSRFQSELSGQKMIDVEVKTLDGLLASGNLPAPGFIKIDIEGAEYDALQGAEALIEKAVPIILIEVHSFALCQSCADWLKPRGYKVNLVQRPLESLTAENFRVCHLLANPAE